MLPREGGTLALPLYPSGYGRLVVGALVASPQARLYGNERLVLFATIPLAVATWSASASASGEGARPGSGW